MGKRRVQTETHQFYCTECGNEGIPIPRKTGEKRESGHIKSLHCLYCEQITYHVEVDPNGYYQYDDFRGDYNRGKWCGKGGRK